MPIRRISRSQAVLAALVVAAVLCSVYVLTVGPQTAASTEGAPQTGVMEPRFYAGEVVARVIDSSGSVTVVRPPYGDEKYTRYLSPVADGLALFPGDQIWTGADSWVEIDFGDEVRVRVDARSRAEVVSGLLPAPGAPPDQNLPTLRLYLGDIWASVVSLVSRFADFSIETPTAIAGVRGTLFNVSVDVLGKTSVSVNEGVVAVAALEERASEVLVSSGEYAYVIAGQHPDAPAPLPPDVEQEWNRRSAWVLAHFERKEAYERRWQLASTGAKVESPLVPEDEAESFAPDPFEVALSSPTGEPGITSVDDSDAADESIEPPDQPARVSGGVGLASVTSVVELIEDDVVEDEEQDDDKDNGEDEDRDDDEGEDRDDGESGENGVRDDDGARLDQRSERGSGEPSTRGLVAEELQYASEKIAERLEEAGIEFDRLWANLESVLNRELDRLSEAIIRHLEDGEDRRPR